mgnify:CR=1 FL=1
MSHTPSAPELERQMAETRSEIEQTIERLSVEAQPKQLAKVGLEKAGEYTTDLAVRQMDSMKTHLHQANSSVKSFLQSRPLTVALIGIGLALLVARPQKTLTTEFKERSHDSL